MATYAAALAYRGLFGLFPFLLLLVVFVGALEFPDFFDRAMDHARSEITPARSAAARTGDRAG
jgi:membrane protein